MQLFFLRVKEGKKSNIGKVIHVKTGKFIEKKWYPSAVTVCIGVVLYVILTNLSSVLSALGRFFGFFKPVILGLVFAYVLSPLARFFYSRVLKKIKATRTRWTFAVILAILTGLLVLVFLISTLIPQLVQSLALFSQNVDNYSASLIKLIENSPLKTFVDEDMLRTLSGNALTSISQFVKENAGKILGYAANSGKGILTTAIALILAVYLLIDKSKVLKGFWRLIRALFKEERTETFIDFVLRCDSILVSFLVQSIFDAIIVGSINAVFMVICRMQYVGLISVIVAVTNLIPNFGPIIGAAIGAFILLLVNPFHALMFLVFTFILQFFDAYILKPKLFSNSLGVSGLLILATSIVLGNMAGILGMLLSIPTAAILSFLYCDYLLPSLERKRTKKAQGLNEENKE